MSLLATRRLLLPFLLLGLLLLPRAAARADLGEDHLYDWYPNTPGAQEALQQGLVSGAAVKACSSEFPSSTQAAVTRWNTAIERSVFSYNCTSPDASVTTGGLTVPEFQERCESVDAHACTFPASVDGETIIGPTIIYMRPEGYFVDGSEHTSRDVTHEFGHVLGHADYFWSSCEFNTIMDTNEKCYPAITTPQPQDVTSYNDAYRPNPVTNLQGYSTAPGRVELTWDPSGVHAEALFAIRRWDWTNNCWCISPGDADKNDPGKALTDQPPGTQKYAVWGWTNALNWPYGDYAVPGEVTVNVQGGVPGKPTINSVQTLGSTSLRVNWSWGNPQGNYVGVERKTGAGGTYAWAGSDTVSPFDNGGLSPGTTYCYRMRAYYDSEHYSEPADEKCGTTSAPPTGSIHFIVKAVDDNGYVLGNVAGATAKLTNTNGTPLGPSATSDANGWVLFDNITLGTYGILAYKSAYVGKAKQHTQCQATQYSTSGATIQYGGYTAAWDNNVLVDGGIEYCYDLGLKCQTASTCYPTNHFQASAYDWNSGAYLGAWDEGDLGSPTNNKTMVNHNWGNGEVAFTKSDNIKIVWRGKVRFPATATYKFILCSDDGSRVDVGIANDSNPVWDINFWWDHGDSCMTYYSVMPSGVYFPIKLEWYEHGGGANIYFEYQKQ